IFALNLAVAFARGERTLLLDGDLRRPSVGKILGLPRDALGLSELLTNRAQLSECVIGTGVKDLHAISTGFVPPDPLHILSSSRMASALKVLAHSFSRIVIDCAPILPVSDAAVLSKHAHCVLYVVKSDTTTVAQIRKGLGLLERVNAPIMGIVLTPHIHPGRYENTRSTIEKAFKDFRLALRKARVALHIGMAAEVRLSPDIVALLRCNEVPFLGELNGHRIILLEFPHTQITPGADKLVERLLQHNIRPLIAHPERNQDVIRDLSKIEP